MTTIVYRDGVMAADTRAYSGNTTPIGFKNKIKRMSDGSLIGVSSTKPGVGEALVEWIENGRNVDEIPDNACASLTAIHVLTNGDVMYYSDSVFPSGPIFAPWYVIGSGDHYAIGALECDVTAYGAVLVAAMHDPWTGGEVQTMMLNDMKSDSNSKVLFKNQSVS